MSAANVLWLPLGELLVERGLLSNVQLELALGEQRRTGLRLGEVLVSMGYVSETALARMLLEQVGLAAEPASPPVVAEQEAEIEQPPPPAPDRVDEPAAEPPATETEVREPEPEPEPEQPEPLVAVVAEPEPTREPLVVVETIPEPERAPEPVIVRLDAPEREHDRGRWWSRNGNKTRVRELEKLLSDFEQRSREIEADITRVRATLRSMRDSRDSA